MFWRSVKPLFLKELFFQDTDSSGRGHCPRTTRTMRSGRMEALRRLLVLDRPI
jgi:hypothetical protein